MTWSMDFVADGLADGRTIRCLTIVDYWSRECLAIEVDTSITGRRVVTVLERLADLRGLPTSIKVDHGPEFECQRLDAWAYLNNVHLAFIRPGKPIERAYVASFNGKFTRGAGGDLPIGLDFLACFCFSDCASDVVLGTEHRLTRVCSTVPAITKFTRKSGASD